MAYLSPTLCCAPLVVKGSSSLKLHHVLT
jgi:hypothetical protein